MTEIGSSKMMKFIKKIHDSAINIPNEEKKIVEFVKSIDSFHAIKVLDVGCGYGKNIKLIGPLVAEIIGVDLNENIVRDNKDRGLNCLTVAEYEKYGIDFDLIIFSHVIEHLYPNDLIEFMENYISRLRPYGHMIISTPLISNYFYEDFDHVKPYHPTGIEHVFCKSGSQVQYSSRNKLKLVDLWFRKGPFKVIFFRGLYLPKYSRFPRIMNLLLALIFRVSFGLIGRTDGWIGLYQKSSR